MVKSRSVFEENVKTFRNKMPSGSIITELISDDGTQAVVRAVISSGNGNQLGSGTAAGFKNTKNKHYIETAETEAINRAFETLGIGEGTNNTYLREELLKIETKHYESQPEELKKLKDYWKVNKLEDLTNAQLMAIHRKHLL